MNSIASLAQLPRSLNGLRRHVEKIIAAENELMALHQKVCERIAQLSLVECELQNNYLFPAVAHWGDDFDGWWDSLPAERQEEVFEYLNTLESFALKRPQLEQAAWSAYMDAFHIEESNRASS
jgi:hypothetical protein